MPTRLRVGLVILATLWLSTRDGSASASRSLSLEERVAAQRAIEQVYWRHRIWPKDNAAPKPSLDAVMPERAIRAKVEDYLKKSNALEVWWHRPITGDQLQAELDRMAKGSRDSRVLQELFDALGNDPMLIAETIARPALADRLTRNWYANDPRFHGVIRSTAERAVATCHDMSCMKRMGGRYAEVTAKLERDDAPGGIDVASDRAVILDAERWQRHLDHVASIPAGRLGGPEETADAFVVTAVVKQKDDEIVTASTTWPKRSFDSWWKDERAKLAAAVAPSTRSVSLPALDPAGCANDTWSPTLADVPDPREGHTAVWTGTEMIVWGGGLGGSELNTGGRYDPATDTWTRTSTGANTPSARFNHTAVWTGTEMIVWGGGSSTNTGGRYDPAQDTWSATSIGANVAPGRKAHTAVWTGTEMIVWGGYGFPSSPDSGGRYNPVTDSWSPTSTGANVPSPRIGHTAIWTGTEMILWGGSDGSGARYNPVTDSWTPTSMGANVPSPRVQHTAVWTGSEMIIWGGAGYGGGEMLNTGGRYDPITDGWTATSTGANVPTGRIGHVTVWTGAKMIVWGGSGSGVSASGAIYDPSANSWVVMGASPVTARTRASAIWTGSEMIVWGGATGSPATQLNTGGRYNPTTDGWLLTSAGTAPSVRGYHSAVWTGSEMIVWGGGVVVSPIVTSTNTGARYTPATDSWLPTSLGANVPTRRYFHSAVWTGSEMIVWGGSDGSVVNTGGRYDPVTDSWVATSTGSNVPAARLNAHAIWTGKEMIVPRAAANYPGGRYDPANDVWTPVSMGPDLSFTGGTVNVWTGTEMILWNGFVGGRYNPSADSWLPVATAPNAPGFRIDPSAVWTGTEMIVWGGGRTNTGARYNPSTDSWTPTSVGANVASPRSLQSAVWSGSEMIVWGGDTLGINVQANSGGRYDPITDSWTPISNGPNLPLDRPYNTAIWTGSEMIVWGGDPATATGARYCACPSGRLVYRDADGDGYGNPGVSSPSCDGSAPAGYVFDFTDCDDAHASTHPTALESCDGADDDCDGLVDESVSGEDSDSDGLHDLCDNCPFVANAAPSDFNNDGQGDACDLDDGLIYEWRDDTTSVSWQAEAGPTSWNVYVGDLDVLKATGVYTQFPGSNALADRHCGELATVVSELSVPPAGKVSFSLIAGVASGVEGSLGSATSGPRTNTNPCP